MAEALGHALMLVDSEGLVRVADERAAELSGLPSERSSTLEWAAAWEGCLDAEGEVLSRDRWPLLRCLRYGERIERTLVGRPRPEGTRWLTITCLPVADVDHPGRRAAILLLDDVTRQRNDERRLQKAQALLASAFDASPQAMVVGGREGRIVEANAAFDRFATGRDRGNAQPWWSFIDPDDWPALFGRIDEVQTDPSAVLDLECRGTDVHGEPVAVRLFGAPVADPSRGGRPPHLAVQISDITDLRRSEARYRTLAETVPVGIFEIDRYGLLADVTPLTEMILASGSPVIGRPADSFVHPSQRHLVRLHFARALEGHSSSAEFNLVHADGRDLVALVCFRPMIGPSGSVESVIGTVLDLTEQLQLQDRLRELGRDIELIAAEQSRERLEAQLAQAQRFEALGRLAGGVAHDFNNLLGVISNYAGFLAKRPDLPDTLRRDVDQIAEAARRGAALTRQLLLFSRREQLCPQRTDLGQLLRELAAMMTGPLRPKVKLRVIAASDIFVVADPGQIEQMLINLLINARDALPDDGGHITMSVRRDDPEPCAADAPTEVVVEVTDTGVGMTPDVLARIFEPFFTTKPRSEASGLGMATVQGIVEQAGGRVQVTSSPGAGTTVAIRLPAG